MRVMVICKKNRDWIYAVAFALGISIFTFLTCTPRQFSDDDWGIANYFAGVIGAEYATPYNKFINFILGWIMYGMYQLLPGPNWFIVIQELIVVLSFALLQYMLISKMKEYIPCGWCYLLTSILLMTFEPSYICRLQYTQTTALGSILGMYWMIFSHKNGSQKGFIFGIGLTIFSALFRFGSYEMCLPFVGVCLFSFFLTQLHRNFPSKNLWYCLKKDAKLYLSIAGIFAILFVLSKANTAIYNSDYYAEYNAFNAARASVVDYAKSPYEDIADELQEIGVSENDYALMTSWTFADLSFFTTDLFRQVAAVEPKASEEINYKEEIDQYFTKLQDPTILYNKLFYMALIILAICLILDFKHMILYVPLLLAGTMVMELYFTIIVHRYPSYVRTGLLFALIVTTLTITDFSKMRVLRGRWYMTVAVSCAMLCGLAPMGNGYYLKTRGTFEYNMDGLAMYEYMNSRDDDIFMIPTGESGGLPPLRNSYSIFEETKPGIMRHTVGLGGWSTNNPWVNEAYHSWGIDYPISQAADDNVYLLATLGKVESIRTYLMEHHGMDTSASLSAVEYGTTIYKITDNKMQIESMGTGVINDVECTYDGAYDTYDISVRFKAGTEDVSKDGRIFISMTDSDGNVGYYMAFDGYDLRISEDNVVLAKVPVSFIKNDTEYAINIMIQVDGVNHLICADDEYFLST